MKSGICCNNNYRVSPLDFIISTRDNDFSITIDTCYQEIFFQFQLCQRQINNRRLITHNKLNRFM